SERPTAWAWAGADGPRHEPLRLVFLRDREELVPRLRNLELVLLEGVGLVPDDALRVRLGWNAVELPAGTAQLQPPRRIVPRHVRVAEPQARESLQRTSLREGADVARSRQDRDVRRIPRGEPGLDLRDEVAGRRVLDLD